MREADLSQAAIDFAGIRDGDTEALENALRIIADRVFAGLQPDGSPNRDLKPDVGLEGSDGDRREAGCVADVFECDFGYEDQADADWDFISKTSALNAGSSFLQMMGTPDGNWLLILQAKPFANTIEVRKKFAVDSGGNVASSPTTNSEVNVGASTSRAEGFEIPIVTADSAYMIYLLSSGVIRSIDVATMSNQDTLTPSVTLDSGGADASAPFLDTFNSRIYWPRSGNGGFVIVDVSDPTALAELGTATVVLTGKRHNVFDMTPDTGEFLYAAGTGILSTYRVESGSPYLTNLQEINLGSFAPRVIIATATHVTLLESDLDYRVYTVESNGTLTLSSSGAVSGLTASGSLGASYVKIDDRIGVKLGGDADDMYFVALEITAGVPALSEEIQTQTATDSSYRYGHTGTIMFLAPASGMVVESYAAVTLGGTKITADEIEARNDLIAGNDVRAGSQLVSETTSKPPLRVTSSQRVPNLNADLLDGAHRKDLDALNIWLWEY